MFRPGSDSLFPNFWENVFVKAKFNEFFFGGSGKFWFGNVFFKNGVVDVGEREFD